MQMGEEGGLVIDCSVKKMKESRTYILNYKQMVFKKLNELKKKGTNLEKEKSIFNMH